jgi:DNA invertase Pin-like site-specific DNA recombinase
MQTLMRRLEFIADESAALMNEAAIRVQRFAAERGLSTQKIDRATHQLLQQWQNAVAEFERDLIVERTRAGLARAKADGKTLGRKPKLDARQQAEVLKRLDAGEILYRVAQTFGVARQVIMRVRDKQGPI